MYLFRPLYRSKNKCGLIKVNKPISYTTTRECIVKRLKLVAPELNLGLHSLRSGGAFVPRKLMSLLYNLKFLSYTPLYT
jgi:hypothetical protein